MELTKEEYLKKCVELLTYFHKDLSKDELHINDGDYSCIMNPNSEFYELFGGHSIYEIAKFVAKELNKELIFDDY